MQHQRRPGTFQQSTHLGKCFMSSQIQCKRWTLFKAKACTLIIQIQWSKSLSFFSNSKDLLEWCYVTFDRKYFGPCEEREKNTMGGNKIRGKENWFKTKMLLLEKYNLKSSWCKRKINVVKCWILKVLQSVFKCHTDFSYIFK